MPYGDPADPLCFWYGAGMIIKEKSDRRGQPSGGLGSRFQEAGDAAERQMAHYLQRAFEKPYGVGLLSKGLDLRVIHDLRIPLGAAPGGRADAVQIDHLVIHPWGMVIVESKSVAGEVAVNGHGEWERVWKGRREGMPSPVEQARRQGEALRGLLQENREALRGRAMLGLVPAGFLKCPMEVLVAISDKGRIDRKRGSAADEVVKADQVTGQIKEIVERHRKGSGLLAADDGKGSGMWSMSEAEVQKVAEFLVSRHVELGMEPVAQAIEEHAPAGAVADDRGPKRGGGGGRPAGPAKGPIQGSPRPATMEARPTAEIRPASSGNGPAGVEALTCGKCRSINVGVVHARYGYCVKCEECGGFTPLDAACRGCGKKARIAKSGPEFRRVCDGEGGCGAEAVFWRNAE
jgi:hypothetical protein